MHDVLVCVYLDAVDTSDVIFDATPPPGGQHISLASKIPATFPPSTCETPLQLFQISLIDKLE